MKLPCTICTLAWTSAWIFPSALSWEPLIGIYSFFDGERSLKFDAERPSQLSPRSADLFFEPWQRE
jgi:hypothetical protein